MAMKIRRSIVKSVKIVREVMNSKSAKPDTVQVWARNEKVERLKSEGWKVIKVTDDLTLMERKG